MVFISVIFALFYFSYQARTISCLRNYKNSSATPKISYRFPKYEAIVVESQYYEGTLMRSPFNQGVAPRTLEERTDPKRVSCSNKQVAKSIQELYAKTKCRPREVLVNLIVPSGNTVYPNSVVVKRCNGSCSPFRQCVPISTRNATFYVRTYNMEEIFCSTIEIPEDISCKCDCIQKPKDCLNNQKYNKQDCRCECNNKDEMKKCTAKNQLVYQWDSSKCQCRCKHPKACTTGSIWSESDCRCVRSLRRTIPFRSLIKRRRTKGPPIYYV